MGEVARPGAYPLIGERPLFDLIRRCGLTDKGRQRQPYPIVQIPDSEAWSCIPPPILLKTLSANVENSTPGHIVVSRAGMCMSWAMWPVPAVS